jgi:hypothetical protein
MMETLFSSAKDAKKREENLGLDAFKTAHGLAACLHPIDTHFASLRVLRG